MSTKIKAFVEGFSVNTNGVKMGGKWYSSTKEVIDYLSQNNKVRHVEATVSDDGKVVTFVKGIEDPVKTETANKDNYWSSKLGFDRKNCERISRQATLNTAVKIIDIVHSSNPEVKYDGIALADAAILISTKLQKYVQKDIIENVEEAPKDIQETG